jgi:hypothetical protein
MAWDVGKALLEAGLATLYDARYPRGGGTGKRPGTGRSAGEHGLGPGGGATGNERFAIRIAPPIAPCYCPQQGGVDMPSRGSSRASPATFGRKVAAVSAVVATMLIPIAASARLNETEAQSQRRYGKPLGPPFDKLTPVLAGTVNRTYDYKGWRIRAAFLKGKAVHLSYSEHSRPNASPRIHPDEAAAVLKGEFGGGTWDLQGKSLDPDKRLVQYLTGYQKWTNTNGNVAYMCPDALFLVVERPRQRRMRRRGLRRGSGRGLAGFS